MVCSPLFYSVWEGGPQMLLTVKFLLASMMCMVHH